MGDRKRCPARDSCRVCIHHPPTDARAPVVRHQVKFRARAPGVGQRHDVLDQAVGLVVVHSLRPRPGAVATLVRGEAAVPRLDERGHELRPHVRSLGKAVQEYDRLAIRARLAAAEGHAVGLDFAGNGH